MISNLLIDYPEVRIRYREGKVILFVCTILSIPTSGIRGYNRRLVLQYMTLVIERQPLFLRGDLPSPGKPLHLLKHHR